MESLLSEIKWRLTMRGTKELALTLEKIFFNDRNNDFSAWQERDLSALLDFLKKDEQWLMDFFLTNKDDREKLLPTKSDLLLTRLQQ